MGDEEGGGILLWRRFLAVPGLGDAGVPGTWTGGKRCRRLIAGCTPGLDDARVPGTWTRGRLLRWFPGLLSDA